MGVLHDIFCLPVCILHTNCSLQTASNADDVDMCDFSAQNFSVDSLSSVIEMKDLMRELTTCPSLNIVFSQRVQL